jgi:hypothetical protein
MVSFKKLIQLDELVRKLSSPALVFSIGNITCESHRPAQFDLKSCGFTSILLDVHAHAQRMNLKLTVFVSGGIHTPSSGAA